MATISARGRYELAKVHKIIPAGEPLPGEEWPHGTRTWYRVLRSDGMVLDRTIEVGADGYRCETAYTVRGRVKPEYADPATWTAHYVGRGWAEGDAPRSPARHPEAPPAEVKALVRAAFPAYRGRRIRVDVTDRPLCCTDTYWDGGSRTRYTFVRLADRRTFNLGDPISGGFAPNADRALDALRAVHMPDGIVCVAWTQGPYESVRVVVRPADVTPALQAGTRTGTEG